jgi:hypothetical protein
MKFLLLKDFLKIFETENITFSKFLKKSVVVVNKNSSFLIQYIKNKNIDINDIKLLYDFILNKNKYLTNFFYTSLQPVYMTTPFIIDEPMKNKHISNNVLVKYKNIIRNLFYLDILQNTKSGSNNIISFFNVIYNLFVNYTIDYKILTPSSIIYLRKGTLSGIFSSFYFRASILNPYVIYSLNKTLLKGTKIFTPVLSWCSPVFGFLEDNNVVEYVATDVIPNVCNKATQIINQFYSNIKYDIYCSPSEDLLNNKQFIKKYKEHFDTIFFCPPYFNLEIYPGKKQSTNVYKTMEEWLEGYWKKTIFLCNYVLCKTGKLCYIIGNNGDNNLINIMNDITVKNGFKLSSSQPLLNKNAHLRNNNVKIEMIFVFTKQ